MARVKRCGHVGWLLSQQVQVLPHHTFYKLFFNKQKAQLERDMLDLCIP